MCSLALLVGCSREEKKTESKNADFVVINILDTPFYEDVHIKGSINVPLMELADYAQGLNKQAGIVVYCSNYACSASGAAAKQLLDMGFENVWAYEGGMAEWYQLQYPVDGPATKDYLRAENKKMEEVPSVPTISSQDLKKRMEEHKLL